MFDNTGFDKNNNNLFISKRELCKTPTFSIVSITNRSKFDLFSESEDSAGVVLHHKYKNHFDIFDRCKLKFN